jgi:hypothetical protein
VTYAALGAYGGIEPWDRSIAETDEVYLWRATFQGADVRGIQDVQAIAAAIGGQQNLGFDLRGIALDISGSGNTYDVDAAFTTKIPRVLWQDPTIDTADDIARKVRVALTGRFPTLQVVNARFEQITDDSPKHPALDFWRSVPIIYEAQFMGPTVPTQAFARFEGLYRGKAEQGVMLKKWPKQPPGNGGSSNGDNGDESVVPLVLLGVGAAAVVYFIYQRTNKQGAAT